jgi:hypothetical protein
VSCQHFDAQFYKNEYPDVELPADELILHYCATGWIEGRNPSPYFDTVAYLAEHRDVARDNRNPLVHYILHGMAEGRRVLPSATPSARTALLFGETCTHWVDILLPHINVDFYRTQLTGYIPPSVNVVAHFAYRGWREGKNPSPEHRLEALTRKYSAAARLLINPLLAHAKFLAGEWGPGYISEPRNTIRTTGESATSDDSVTSVIDQEVTAIQLQSPASHKSSDSSIISEATETNAELEAIRSEFSVGYYLTEYKDVNEAGVDPTHHYYFTGWKEGRNPTNWFNTLYYLKANKDVESAGINPFWHYLVAGRAEGRRCAPAGGYRRRVIEAALEPTRRTENYSHGKDVEVVLNDKALQQKIRQCLVDKVGIVVSFSHDCYTLSVGGTQIVISDEKEVFNSRRYGYCHLSPKTPLLTLAEADDAFQVRIVLDGIFIGTALLSSLRSAFLKNRMIKTRDRQFVVHCLLGFNAEQVSDFWSELKPNQSYYWLHDFSSICEGFNLLRNDVLFCAAPGHDSMACRVCVYGARRREHLAAMQTLFQTCNFKVIAPSTVTLDLWRQVSTLPYQSAKAHPHWQLRKRSRSRKKRRSGKVRVAFLGYRSANKGWPIFCELASALEGDARYELYHFVDAETTSLPEVRVVRTRVTPADRNAAIRLLREHAIDFVALLSPWPETFSFVAHEALVAGAELVCIKDSGNVAALVASTGSGVVLPDASAVIGFFLSGEALERCSAARQISMYEIVPSGATSSFTKAISIE